MVSKPVAFLSKNLEVNFGQRKGQIVQNIQLYSF